MKKSICLNVGLAIGAVVIFASACASAKVISFYDTGAPNPTDVLNVTGGLTGGDTQVGAGAFTDTGVFVIDPGELLTSYNITSQHSGSLYTISGGTMEIFKGATPLPQTLVDIPLSNGTQYVSTGSDQFTLTAGTYTVVIKSFGILPPKPKATAYATYSVELQGSPVPEAPTWAIMLAGFGAVGGAMRAARGKKAAVSA